MFRREKQPQISRKDYDRAVAAALNAASADEPWTEDNVAIIENDWTYSFVRDIIEAAGIKIND